MMSLTKYVGGHSDAMMGSLTATPALWSRLRKASYQLGHAVSPDDCALILRGLRTLDVRLQRPGANGLDRTSVVSGKSVSVRVAPGGRRINKKKITHQRSSSAILTV